MPEQESSTPERIEDVDKALVMAHAEKPFRDYTIEKIDAAKNNLLDRYVLLGEAVKSGNAEDIKPNQAEKYYAFNYEGKNDVFENGLSSADTVPIAKKLVENDDWRTHGVRTRFVAPTADKGGVPSARQLAAEIGVLGQGKAGMHPDHPGHNAQFGLTLKEIMDLQKEEYDQKPVDPSRTMVGDLAAKEAGNFYDLTHDFYDEDHPEDKAD